MTSVSQSVPWVEKYRPSNFSKIVLDPINRTIFKNIINKDYFPNLLFYGPPGTGKTLLARALASNINATFLKVVASAIVDKYIGETAPLNCSSGISPTCVQMVFTPRFLFFIHGIVICVLKF